jgi:hypothetical protein
LLLLPPWGFGYLDFGCLQLDGFVEGYFLLVLGFYCFNFSLSSWHYLVNGLDFLYSIVQKSEAVEWEMVEKS